MKVLVFSRVARSRAATSRGAGTGLLAAALLVAGCSVGGPSSGGDGDRSSGDGPDRTVVVATHDSWNMPRTVLAEFTRRTGYRVRIEPNGDVGALTNKLVLTKGSPIADAVYGIDNTFASRAVDQGVLARSSPPRPPASASRFALPTEQMADRLSPVDYSDVCVNVDDGWFRRHDLPAPRTLDDLVDPRYRGLFVTPGAATSSPGLAFLLATIAKYGDRWPAYWRRLMANDTKLTSGWTDAYEVDFTRGGGDGDRPIVLSYSSSPPVTIPKGGTRPTSRALLDTCFRQVEYAGVLAGAGNAAGARAFVRFLQQQPVQRALPDNMYVYPVDTTTPLPGGWRRFAPAARHPFEVPPDQVAAHRDEWLRTWADVTSG